MNVFAKRYFVWISLIFLTFSYLSYYFSGEIFFIIFTAVLGISYAIICFFKKNTNNVKIVCALILCAALLGTVNTCVDLFSKDELERKYSGEHSIKGYIKNIVSDESFIGEHIAVIEEIDGDKASFELILVTEYQSEFETGDFFIFDGNILSLSEYSGAKYLKTAHSGEHNLVCILAEGDEIEYLEDEFHVTLMFSNLNSRLSAKLKQLIGEESGALASALLLGNRDLLSESTLRDFKRAGVYHMLALSGLHVSILIGLLEFVLKKLGVPKLYRIITLAVISLFYIALTGFLLSACRSMLMLWILYLTFILEKVNDGMTSLFLAVSLIVLIHPYAILDVGLLLSFLSTFGVVSAVIIVDNIRFPEISRKNEPLKAELVSFSKKCITLVLISLCTFVMTLPVLMIYFGEVSLATFISNLFMGVICEVFMLLALLILVLPISSPICLFLAEVGHNFGDSIMGIVEKIADTENVMLSLSYPNIEFLVWGIFITSLVIFGMKLYRKWLLALPCVIFAVLMCFNICSYNMLREGTVRAEYVCGDALVISSNDGVYICDASNGRYGTLYESANIAKENCFTEIDGVILTHYHSYHPISLERFSKSCKLHCVFLPMPKSYDEGLIMRTIVRVLEKEEIKVYIYDTNEALEILGGELTVSDRAYMYGYEHPSVALTYSFGENRLTLMERPYFGTYLEESEGFEKYIAESDYLIFGSDGNTPKERFELFSLLKETCEVSYSDFELFELSDYERYLEKMKIYFDVDYKKYDLK